MVRALLPSRTVIPILENGKGTYQAKAGWVYEGDFVNGQAEGKGKLTTEQEVVYEGDFKQGLFQQAQ